MNILNRNQKGSLLLEALLSVVILSVSISVMIETMTASLRSTVYSADYTKVIISLENQMVAYLEQTGGSHSLEQERADDKFQYSVKTSSLDKEDQKNLEQVKIEALWNTKGKNNILSVDSYHLVLSNEKQ